MLSCFGPQYCVFQVSVFCLRKNPEFGTELKFINSKFHAPNLEHFEVTMENLKMCGVSMLHQHEAAVVETGSCLLNTSSTSPCLNHGASMPSGDVVHVRTKCVLALENSFETDLPRRKSSIQMPHQSMSPLSILNSLRIHVRYISAEPKIWQSQNFLPTFPKRAVSSEESKLS